MVFKLKTSKETMQIFEELGASIHLQPFALCKIALALSLRNVQKKQRNRKSDFNIQKNDRNLRKHNNILKKRNTSS